MQVLPKGVRHMPDFLDRAAGRLSTFDSWDEIAYLNTLDPTSDSEPHESYGC